jgi:hypothetical protein
LPSPVTEEKTEAPLAVPAETATAAEPATEKQTS